MGAAADMVDTGFGDRYLAIRPPGASGDQDCGRMVDQEWHVVATEYQAERLAAASIRSLDFQAFLPLIRIRLPATSKRPSRTETRPAFPGYLFVLWQPEDRWQGIKGEPGVARIISAIGNSEAPAVVSVGFMMLLLSRASQEGVIEDLSVPDLLPPLAPSTWVRITGGHFAGHRAFCEWSTDERVGLLLEVLGGPRRAEIRRDQVEPTP